MKLFIILLSFLGIGSSVVMSQDNESDDQLWIMVKTDTYFRSQNELELLDEITALQESKDLGELDGHSSGSFQFEFNFLNVTEFKNTKRVIEGFISEEYPKLTYTIATNYEITYENL